MTRKRGKLAITESILQALKQGPELKTNIAYKSKIDSRTISKYLRFLTEQHLVELASPRKYKITRKGLEFLKQFAKVKKYGA